MASSRARVLTPQQWEEQKTYIVRQYLEKKYTLKVVQDKLTKRGFHATEGQLRTHLKHWGIRKPRRGSVVTVADASSGQNGENTLTGDASVGEDDRSLASQIVEDGQHSESTVMGSQPTFEERDHAFLVNPAIAPEELHTASPQVVEQSSFRTAYDLVGNQARVSQTPSYSTRYGLVGNEARASQAPSYSTRYGVVGNEARASQAPSYSTRYGLVGNGARISQALAYSMPYNLVGDETQASQARSYSPRYGLVYNEAQSPPSFQYSTSGSDAQYQHSPFGLQYETSDGHSGYSQGFSVEQHGETLADDLWSPTESINRQPDTTSR